MHKKQTVNVVEYAAGAVQQVIAFDDTPEGNSEAHKLFEEMAKANGMDAADADDCVRDGLYEQGDYQIFLIDSTCLH